ncbi:transcriptional regulator, AraC family [Gluconacetobacter diazotrophicus PA1 5]|uniref:Helix-turn-helix transcriptional regulator n=2 Tax=Gluconacetobacter diazotrophicus TaxID=33996 RepID=A0A7W4FD66_GLUDI|nr:AraC family transcriptional regulator [Gluconacetobacter diazotrophicus]ACI51840.1 transcriptional regulator, AraC family [Gluconacetobacter diazotrophicus PA1 5]MBB2155605.1 helix-turn-helix transcriptional regulator [Gluconacetobacter diazotrophicus]TWB11184.1 AraC family transcriptional regulator [Gluconacetobacter diazotrophicus]CAP55319.1 putative AraC-family transcriptional regulator [Gluconacetobacter diazotrophicus PA1 5]
MGSTSRGAGNLHDARRRQVVLSDFVVSDSLYAPSLRIARHDHELASLCLVLSGGYQEVFGQRARTATPGMLIVHPPGEHHADRHAPSPTRILTIEIAAHALDHYRQGTGLFSDAMDRHDPGIVGLGMRLARAIRDKSTKDACETESIVSDILDHACLSVQADARGAKWLLAVRDYLHAHPGRQTSMRELAALANVHPIHLARAFRTIFGCSIGRYMRRLRVGVALSLLHDGESGLADVADLAGFSDQSHMTRLVKASTGQSPGRLRGDRMF